MGFVAGAGIVNCDLLYGGLPRLPGDGEEVYSASFEMQLGGGIPATMVNLARLNVPIRLQTFLGEDFFSSSMKQMLRDKGVDYVNLYHGGNRPINITSVAVTPHDRSFLTSMGEISLTEEDIRLIYEQSKGAKIVRMLAETGNEQLIRMYRRLKEEGSVMTLDTGWEDDLSLEKYRDYLELADYYTPNEKEALKITGTESVEAAADVLGRYFDHVVIKMGKAGCFYRSREGDRILKPMEHVRAVDATGAGDAFMAGFIYGLYHDYAVADCIRLGNVMGGYCVQAVGCLTRFPGEEELLGYLSA